MNGLKDSEAIVALFRDNADALYRAALRMLGNEAEAEDAVQDTFVRLRRSGQRPGELDRPDAWLFAVLRNNCVDRLRRAARRGETDVPMGSEVDPSATDPFGQGALIQTPETEVLSAETLRQVNKAMAALPRVEAEALTLVAIEGLSYRDVADITQVPVGTVRSRLSRARKTLRTALHGALADGPGSENRSSETELNNTQQNVIHLRRTSP